METKDEVVTVGRKIIIKVGNGGSIKYIVNHLFHLNSLRLFENILFLTVLFIFPSVLYK